jgi:prolyl oligopeptidase
LKTLHKRFSKTLFEIGAGAVSFPALFFWSSPPMRRAPAFLAALFLSTAVNAQSVPERPKPAYPHTRSVDLIEDQFGEKVADPYRWLEDDVRVNKDVAAWVAAQNDVTNAYLKTLKGRDVLANRMKQLFDFERYSTPRKAGGRYFYMKNDGLQNQSVLYVRDGLNGTSRVLIDPNGWAKDGATALAEWSVSDDGSHILYAIQDGGTDWRTLKLLNVATGKVLEDEIKWVKFSNLAWAKDGRGFYYSRFAEPQSDSLFPQDWNAAIRRHQNLRDAGRTKARA